MNRSIKRIKNRFFIIIYGCNRIILPTSLSEYLAQQTASFAQAAQQRPDGSIDYRMGFDEGTEDDISFRCEGVQVVMAPEYVPLLDAATLDFVELDAGDPQFIFLNPKDATYVEPSEN